MFEKILSAFRSTKKPNLAANTKPSSSDEIATLKRNLDAIGGIGYSDSLLKEGAEAKAAMQFAKLSANGLNRPEILKAKLFRDKQKPLSRFEQTEILNFALKAKREEKATKPGATRAPEPPNPTSESSAHKITQTEVNMTTPNTNPVTPKPQPSADTPNSSAQSSPADVVGLAEKLYPMEFTNLNRTCGDAAELKSRCARLFYLDGLATTVGGIDVKEMEYQVGPIRPIRGMERATREIKRKKLIALMGQ